MNKDIVVDELGTMKCETCGWWKPEAGIYFGNKKIEYNCCTMMTSCGNYKAAAYSHEDVWIKTTHDFYCNEWKAKENDVYSHKQNWVNSINIYY